MDVTCPRCDARHSFDAPATVRAGAARSLRFRCPACGYAFQVDTGSRVGPPPPPASVRLSPLGGAEPETGAGRGPTPMGFPGRVGAPGNPLGWVRVEGTLFAIPDRATLQRWILERRVLRDDLWSPDGQAWLPVREDPELQLFFVAAERLAVAAGTSAVSAPAARPAPVASAAAGGPVAPLPEEDEVTQAELPRVAGSELDRRARNLADAAFTATLPGEVDEVETGLSGPTAPAAGGGEAVLLDDGAAARPPAPPAIASAPPSPPSGLLSAPLDPSPPVPLPSAFDDLDPPPPPPRRWGRVALAAIGAAVLGFVGVTLGVGALDRSPAPAPAAPSPPAAPDPVDVLAAELPAPATGEAATPAPSVPEAAAPAPSAPEAAAPAPSSAAPAAPAAPDRVPVKTAVASSSTSAGSTAAGAPRVGVEPRSAAWRALEAGEHTRAYDLFSRALQDAPGDPSLLYGRGLVSERLGDPISAGADFCDALAREPAEDLRAKLQAAVERIGRACG